MPKALLYSDLHIRPERLADCDHALTVIGQAAKEHGVEYIINLGDTFDVRGIVHTGCLETLRNHYLQWAKDGLKQIILVGNHDQEDREGVVHPMRVFASYPGWVVVDRPMVIRRASNWAFFPYMHKITEADIDAVVRARNIDYAFVHWGIKGAKRNDKNVDTDGVPPEWIAKKVGTVFSGHYHYRSTFGMHGIQYVGSPIQQDFGERDQEKGYMIFDEVERSSRFYPIMGTRKHHQIEVLFDPDGNPAVSGDMSDIQKGDFLKATIKGEEAIVSGFSDADLRKLIPKEANPGRLLIERDINDGSSSRIELTGTEIHSTRTVMQKYVDHVDTDLDKERLLNMGFEMLEGLSHE